MLITIDAGNTQTVVGLYRNDIDKSFIAKPGEFDEHSNVTKIKPEDGLVDHWRIATAAQRTSDELTVMLRGFLALSNHDFSDISGVAICSGVPRITASLRSVSEKYFMQSPVVLEPGVKTGIAIAYDNPKEVGADRIANAIAAHDLYTGPTIIVDFGTATTCDAVTADGTYVGGAICPGVEISLDALVGRASALHAVELREPRSVLGRTTTESIQAGVLYGYAAQVDGLCSRIEDELGPCTIVATGGLADVITPVSKKIKIFEPWLTLHGLRLLYGKNV